jgi:chemotaxis protein MotA
MAAYAPAFGMLGTVLGLIIMMNKFQMSGETSSVDFNVADQFQSLLVGMGTALITTFYGVFLANMVFLPLGGKLKRRSENEIMLKNIVLEGIISIHGREHPVLIKEKLMTFVAMSERKTLETKKE